ncbi:phosphatidylinositol N-acetylglucosaminyltransferase subunit P [Babesia caballi]|uniref:Phosphatidylinositol N-acetylglucosaminyltransferase subunit P n=1 Tax=Babesia caballi TaxID=5871 RepID=A0AAV4LN97_BABCB|nr:phosphatidylinositol N-acetylglucosaminyltransferase subunit P [Babesia caballi]
MAGPTGRICERAADAEVFTTMEIEIKAYVSLIFCYVSLGLYFLWALTPEWLIHSYGITYYPSKHWAVALPSSLLLMAFFIIAYNFFSERSMLPPLNGASAFTDTHAEQSQEARRKQKIALYDVSIESVNKMLYG